MTGLFRREVYDSAELTSDAEALDVSNEFFRYCTLGAALVLALLVAYLYFGSYSPKRTVVGYTVAEQGLARVHSPFNATVLERYVEPGQEIVRGQPLYRLTVPRSTTGEDDVSQHLVENLEGRRHLLVQKRELEAQRARIEASALERQVATAREQAEVLEREMRGRRRANELRRAELVRMGQMLESGVVSRSRYEQEQANLLERESEISALERKQLEFRAQVRELQSQIEILNVYSANARTEIDGEIAVIEQELLQTKASSAAVVRAPISGTISDLVYEPGQQAQPDVPLLSILPKGSTIHARLLVPSSAIGLVEKGQPVVLNYRAFPYQSYGSYRGTVATIARSAITAEDMNLPIRVTEPVYLVTVEVRDQFVAANGKKFLLQTGMLLDADIVVGHMRLYEWILQPLYRLKGNV